MTEPWQQRWAVFSGLPRIIRRDGAGFVWPRAADSLFYGALATPVTRSLLIVTALLAGCAAEPPEVEPLPDYPLTGRWAEGADLGTRDGALAVLRDVDSFAGPTVGDGGGASPHATAFRTVLNEPDAAALFAELVEDARPAGQLYGLAGLQLTEPSTYKRALPRYLVRTDSITTAAGCIISNGTVGDVAKEIASGGIVRDLAATPS